LLKLQVEVRNSSSRSVDSTRLGSKGSKSEDKVLSASALRQ
jgi:hypothetical protein